MEITIPGWAMTLIGTFGGGWLWWMIQLTRMANQANSDNRLSDLRDLQIQKDITDIKNKLDNNHNDFHEQLRDLTKKVDTIMGDFQFIRGSLQVQVNKTTG